MSGLLSVIDALIQSNERALNGYLPLELFSFRDALNAPGLIYGTLTEINGHSLSGKTSMSMAIVRAAQMNNDLSTLWIDAEGAFDPEYAKACGIDLERLFVWRTPIVDDILSFFEQVLPLFPDLFSLIVIDSSTALVARKELQNKLTTFSPFIQYEYVSYTIEKISAMILDKNVSVVMINQLRTKLSTNQNRRVEATFESAFKRFARMRIQMTSSISSDNMTVNGDIYINKEHTQRNQFSLHLEYGSGISFERDLILRCLSKGLIIRNGSWYSDALAPVKHLGIQAMVDHLKTDHIYRETLYTRLKCL